jgi:hypothetical protein
VTVKKSLINFYKLKNIPSAEKKNVWSKFAGLASQWAVAIFVLLFFGKYLDSLHLFELNAPIFIWILPFIFIIFSLIRIIKETSTSNVDKNKH